MSVDPTGPLPQEILQQTFGHPDFRGQQSNIIDRILDDQHALVIMPTGMGKSLCFQIPAIVLRRQSAGRRQLSLVISPLIALMKDQVDSLQAKGVDASFINSSLTRSERIKRYQNVAEGHYDLLYVTPERFRKAEFVEIIGKRKVGLLAVDGGLARLGEREVRRAQLALDGD